MSKCNALYMEEQENAAREEAVKRVLAVRGSNDAPGFDACVESEMVNILEQQQPRESDNGL